jgi:DNA/RNA endonuclease G (NUC1)
MKKEIQKIRPLWWLLLILSVIGCNCFGQTIKHHGYTTCFNAKLHCPDSVSWNLSPANICKLVPRKDKFAKDPLNSNSPKPSDFIQLAAYKTNKTVELAQGHLYSYESAMCNPIDNTECFFVDQMYEQYQGMNAGDWKTVEVYERSLAATQSIHVIAGYIGITSTLSTSLPIVTYMYKAIYHGGKWEIWIMPNLPGTKGHKYLYWKNIYTTDAKGKVTATPITTAILDAKTGLKL